MGEVDMALSSPSWKPLSHSFVIVNSNYPEIMNRRLFTLSHGGGNSTGGNGPFTIQGQPCSRGKLMQTSRTSPNPTVLMSRGPSLSAESYLSQINEIEDGLYLCGARALTQTIIRDLGISCIINVTVELPNVPYAAAKGDVQIETVKIPIDDSPYANLAYYFERTIDKMQESLRHGNKVLVHCVAGVSRSASIIIAFLMKHRQMTLRRAFEHVKSRRPIIRPNPGFFRQLIDYESRLFGKATVKMGWNAAAGGHIPDVYEHEYLNTMNFITKYGCYHKSQSRGGDEGGFSRTWPGGVSILSTRCSR